MGGGERISKANSMKELQGDVVSCTVNFAEFGNSVLLLSVYIKVAHIYIYMFECSTVT